MRYRRNKRSRSLSHLLMGSCVCSKTTGARDATRSPYNMQTPTRRIHRHDFQCPQEIQIIVYDWIRQLMSLTALPAFAVPLAWDWWLRFPPATASSSKDAKLQEFADYFDRTWVRGEFPAELWTHYDHNGPRTTNATEVWHNSLNTHFGTPHPSLRVFLHWLQKCQFEVQGRCIQLAAGRPPKQQLSNYAAVNKDVWDAKVRYGMDIGHIFAVPIADVTAIHYSRMCFRTVTEQYLRWCSHMFGCN